MLQWFNKQSTLSSSSSKRVEELQHSGLGKDDYEFLFNQLLDGVAHGWHIGKIIKFFNNLESLSSPSEWLIWLEEFEQKIIYAADDPSKQRIGAIMMRFGELTQSNLELEKLGSTCHRIGHKLFLGNTAELVWEYSGQDRVVQTDNPPESTELRELGDRELISLDLEKSQESIAEIPQESKVLPEEKTEPASTSSVTNPTATRLYEIPEPITEFPASQEIEGNSVPSEPSQKESLAETKLINEENYTLEEQSLSADLTESKVLPEEKTEPASTSSKEALQPTPSPDLEPLTENTQSDFANSIESLEALTEQLTVLQDDTTNPEKLESDREIFTNTKEELSFQSSFSSTAFTEQPTESPDFIPEPEPEPETKNSLETLEELTEQLIVLQETVPEAENQLEINSESTLIAPEIEQSTASAPLSVASFLEATKTLVPQPKNPNLTPLTWEEFIAVLEEDQILAQQVAQYLQISSTDPQDIVQAAVNRLTKQEETKLSPATIELIESWFNLGLKQASAEDFQGAISSWEKALNLNSHLSEAWHNKGSALGRLGKYEAAIHSFNQAIHITPERYQAWNDRAHALYQIHKWEQAVESWDKAISIMPDHYQFWYNRACALEQLQRYDESISSYQKALEIKPDFQPARSRYINLVTENSSSSPN